MNANIIRALAFAISVTALVLSIVNLVRGLKNNA